MTPTAKIIVIASFIIYWLLEMAALWVRPRAQWSELWPNMLVGVLATTLMCYALVALLSVAQ